MLQNALQEWYGATRMQRGDAVNRNARRIYIIPKDRVF